MRSSCLLTVASVLWCLPLNGEARQHKSPVIWRAVIIDERLAALRQAPAFDAPLLRRLGRGRQVTVTAVRRSAEGVDFCRTVVTRRTRGWLQRESLIFPHRKDEDERLRRLIDESGGFDRLVRAQIFLKSFPHSKHRPAVLAAAAETAEKVAGDLTRAARRRLAPEKLSAHNAPEHTYYLNFSGLDRYRRQGIRFVFRRRDNSFGYDGAHWREILRRHPHSAEAERARASLAAHK